MPFAITSAARIVDQTIAPKGLDAEKSNVICRRDSIHHGKQVHAVGVYWDNLSGFFQLRGGDVVSPAPIRGQRHDGDTESISEEKEYMKQ